MEADLGLLDFLGEAELAQYHETIKNELKVRTAAQLKDVKDEDLEAIGMSRPERRRLRRVYSVRLSRGYLSRLRRLLSGGRTSGGDPRSPIREAISDSMDGHIIPAERIAINKRLGGGEFGVVQQGVWNDRGRSLQVAVKCLYKDQMLSNAGDFLKEAAIMHAIEHENVVRFYGVVLHPQSLMLVTELAPLRSLLECLKEISLRSTFTVLTLCDFALQISRGMQYLESRRLIHRDLAARNVLVFSKNEVKISDFGLSRALGAGKDYYRTDFSVNLKLPIAWCAPECIGYLRFTSASDVWAYAVTLWEMFSYGFQPWAAFSGREILTAIDTPNCQRLERPERCPREYYALMNECWAHEPSKRPRFSDIVQALPDCRPERVKTVALNDVDLAPEYGEKLNYKVGEAIVVLDKTSPNCWKGVLNGGGVGFFNPSRTISFLGSPLITSEPFNRSSDFCGIKSALIRDDRERGTVSKRKLRGDMISAPQGDLRHTGHVGLDGAHFGDVSFLKNEAPPRQIVTPYRPSDDLEQTPLIDPNSPSHLTGNASPAPLRPLLDVSGETEFRFDDVASKIRPSKFVRLQDEPAAEPGDEADAKHDYQEISDDERKSGEFGQSILDEMELMFKNYSAPIQLSESRNVPEDRHDHIDVGTRTTKKKGTMKMISAHDRRTLDSALALANKIGAKSMSDPDAEEPPHTPTSPTERSKFSFRFPLVGTSSFSHGAFSGSFGTITKNSETNGKPEKRNFSQEARSVPDIQTGLTDECKMAYKSLIEGPRRLETTLIKIKQKNVLPVRTIPTEKENMSSFKPEQAPESSESNPLPVPPRDHTKRIDAGKRHVRKYPLVIGGASNGDRQNGNVFVYPDKEDRFNEISTDAFDGPSLNFEAHIENHIDELDPAFEVDDVFEHPFRSNRSNFAGSTPFDDVVDGKMRSITLSEESNEGFEPESPHNLAERSADRVSVEDLLEFADRKPPGRQRGTDSDEVRIMCKVLNRQISPEACLSALEFASWDVHRAIKLAKLRFMGLDSPTLYECSRALEECDWDVARAASILADSSDITQV